jgi:hypothetical protein
VYEPQHPLACFGLACFGSARLCCSRHIETQPQLESKNQNSEYFHSHTATASKRTVPPGEEENETQEHHTRGGCSHPQLLWQLHIQHRNKKTKIWVRRNCISPNSKVSAHPSLPEFTSRYSSSTLYREGQPPFTISITQCSTEALIW